MMVLDECLPYPSKYEDTRTSLELTTAWAKRSKLAKTRTDNFMFGIVQGGDVCKS